MEKRLWTAEDLEQLTPAEQDALFNASIVTNLEDVPGEFLEKIRTRVEQRLAQGDAPPR